MDNSEYQIKEQKLCVSQQILKLVQLCCCKNAELDSETDQTVL